MVGDADEELAYGTEFAAEPGAKPPKDEKAKKKMEAAATSRETCCETMRPGDKKNSDRMRGC